MSDSEAETIDGAADEAADRAAVLRKRAGLPELCLDVLPSTIAMKLLTLAGEPCCPCRLRKCLSKRAKFLQDGLDMFKTASNLSDLQKRTVLVMLSACEPLPGCRGSSPHPSRPWRARLQSWRRHTTRASSRGSRRSAGLKFHPFLFTKKIRLEQALGTIYNKSAEMLGAQH